MLEFIEKTFGKLFGNKHEKDVKALNPLVEQINQEFESFSSLSNDELRAKSGEFKARIAEYLSEITDEINQLKKQVENNRDMDVHEKEEAYNKIDKLIKEKDENLELVLMEILPAAFATVKETARRFSAQPYMEATATELDRELAVEREHITISGNKVTYAKNWLAAGSEIEWNMVHYDVQLIGGMVLHQGKIAEMATGEGKTLVATLPAYLNGLAGAGVHIVTVNDYLARRDSEWMAPIFQFLGLTVDCIDKHQPHSPERKSAYNADVTYGTNNAFGFDYLRDNMVRLPTEMVQRKPHYAMVDEVDSVLIDDARTPLIISGPVEQTGEREFYDQRPRISRLFEAQKKLATGYLADAKRLIKEGKDGYEEGQGGMALLRAFRGIPKYKPLIKFLSEPGVRQILLKAENFYLQDQAKNMPEVDKELFFVIEEKTNSVELKDKGIDMITQSGEDPEQFIIPDVGALMADVEKSEKSDEDKANEKSTIMHDFAIKAERLHTIQQLLKAYTLFEKDVEYVVMDGKVKIVDENTGRIMEGRRYSDGLHQAIEAKENVKIEAATQTFATITLQNYFRMYHKLAGMTGTAETEAGEFWNIYELDVVVIPTNRPIVRDDREDLVYKTQREKFKALADEIIELKNAGRPVLVGTTSVDVSELLSRMLRMQGVKHNVLNAKQHQREAEVVTEAGKPGTITIATNMAGRGTDIKISDEVKANGGLAIVGSERHDSRRIDRQLRGRAGRQGDPGSSQFYVSLEDNLMRLFGSERISKVMDRLGYEEGEVIQHSMITKSLERAQKKVEENNFGIRKRLLEYDDVMNTQREVIYKKRQHALFGDRLSLDILNSFYDLCSELVAEGIETRDLDEFKMNVIRHFSLDPKIDEKAFQNGKVDELVESLFDQVQLAYRRKCDHMATVTLPVFKRIQLERGETVKNVAVPITDGKKGMNVLVNLDQAVNTEGAEVIKSFEKTVSLALIDDTWKEHLRQMDDLKQEVQAAAYEQKDPLIIYKLEAFNLFKAMLSDINRAIASFLFKGNLPVNDPNDVKAAQQPQRTNMDRMKAARDTNNGLINPGSAAGQSQQRPDEAKKLEPVRTGPKVGRNDPCPCGSGKKYKKCHGA